jgi:hypothetical protein
LVCGTSDTGIDGGWKVTKLSDNDYQLSQRLFSFPSGFVSPRDCEFGIFGKIRFPSAPAICGKVKVIGASNAAPIVLGLAEDVWLRDGDRFFVQGVSGNSAANGYQTALVRGPREIALSGTSGNGNYSAGGFAFSPFAVDEKWNDTESKGEYSFQTWDFNFRDVGEFVRLSGQYNDPSLSGCAGVTMPDPVRPNAFANGYPSEISNMACGTHCLGYKNCAPSVIAITPNGETWPNAMNHGFGSMGLDSKYGAQWQAQIKQHVTDPLWQPPHKPCINPTVIDEEGDVHPQHVHWLEDDGTCNQDSEDILGDGISTIARRYYPLRPFVESRCDAPADAPLLPQGIYLGCLTFDQLQTLPMPSGIVCGPPNPVGHSDKYPRTTPMPWGWYLRELSCVCGNVRPEFADVYRANGVDCKEEVPPP